MNTNTSTNNKPKRIYRKITPEVITEHKAQTLLQGSGTKAVIQVNDDVYSNPADRAYHIQRQSDKGNAIQYIDDRLQQISVTAINRVDEMLLSDDERIATKNAHFVIDHVRGKALQRSDNRNVNISIESILD